MSGYCTKCPKRDWCSFPCQMYLDYLSVISECLNGHANGDDPCSSCMNKGDSICPLFGNDKEDEEVFERGELGKSEWFEYKEEEHGPC